MLKKQDIVFSLLLSVLSALLFSEVLMTQHFISSAQSANATVISQQQGQAFNNTVYRFRTGHNTRLQTQQSSLQQYQLGQQVEILYNPIIPALYFPNDKKEIWFWSMVYGALLGAGFLSWGLLYLVRGFKQKRQQKIRKYGNHIYTKFDTVEAVLDVKENGKHPYRIVSSWQDLKTKKKYTFKSPLLWENPIEYIMQQTITVMIDKKSRKKYLMDLSFLPERLRGSH